MATAVIMPRQGQSVESCVISEWFKAAGDAVAEGDILFSYETDKAAFEEASKLSGTLLAVFFEAGDDVPCLTNVAVIGEAGEDISAFKPEGAPKARDTADEVKRVMTVAANAAEASAPRAKGVSPRAREAARRMGVDPLSFRPTGPNGRVIERDIFAGEIAEAAPEADYTDKKLSNMRRIIGAAMTESLSTMAQLTHFSTFDATRLFALREELNAKGVRVSVTDVVVFAASRVLKNHPSLNAHLIGGDTLRLFSSVNMGLAVDTERGLLVPTIFGADKMSLTELANESRRLADAARAGNISPDLLTGGTFTVSSLGSLRTELFTPIINPPQTGILGLCAAVDRPRLTPNGIELYPATGLALTYDHRAMDGAPAQRFLAELIDYLEQIKGE